MNRFATISAAASLAVGTMMFGGCQGQGNNNNPDNSGAQTSGDEYRGTYDNTNGVERSDSARSDAADRNDEAGRGLTSANMDTHGGPSRITGGENVDRNGLDVSGSPSGTLNDSDLTPQRTGDAVAPTTRPANTPTTQPSVILSQ